MNWRIAITLLAVFASLCGCDSKVLEPKQEKRPAIEQAPKALLETEKKQLAGRRVNIRRKRLITIMRRLIGFRTSIHQCQSW